MGIVGFMSVLLRARRRKIALQVLIANWLMFYIHVCNSLCIAMSSTKGFCTGSNGINDPLDVIGVCPLRRLSAGIILGPLVQIS